MTAPNRAARAQPSGRLVGSMIVALVFVIGAAAALVWAQQEQTRVEHRHALLVRLLASQGGTRDLLTSDREAFAAVRPQIDAIAKESQQVDALQTADVALLQAALDAGKKGDVPAYNDAVAKRNVLAPQVDAAIEKLRTDTNPVLLALAKVTNRAAP